MGRMSRWITTTRIFADAQVVARELPVTAPEPEIMMKACEEVVAKQLGWETLIPDPAVFAILKKPLPRMKTKPITKFSIFTVLCVALASPRRTRFPRSPPPHRTRPTATVFREAESGLFRNPPSCPESKISRVRIRANAIGFGSWPVRAGIASRYARQLF